MTETEGATQEAPIETQEVAPVEAPQETRVEAQPETPIEAPKEAPKRRWPAIRRALLTGAAFLIGFLVFFFVAVAVWDYSNSPAFCADVCHGVHPEETITYRDSYHANVQCTECHMSRVSMLNNIFLKAGHIRHVPETLFGLYERPLESQSLRPASQSCELCHYAPAEQGDILVEKERFLPDEDNTELRTYLISNVGGGGSDDLNTGMGYGIHWHALNRVEYIATDEEKEHIPWVRATLPDGRTIEYADASYPMFAEGTTEEEVQVMDCVDCHNRVGHPFLPPGETIDGAMAEGRISTDLPFIKKEMLELLDSSFASQEEALGAVGAWKAQYEAKYPEAAATMASEIDQAAQLASELLTRLVFEEAGITWESFPDHGEHQESAGCFRCHDGKHLSEEGESIRLECNVCHSIPQTVRPGEAPPAVLVADVDEPPSHLESNFIADHRFQASDECVACHGEIAFGDDDSSFCANSACHGRAWPSVDLDAAFPHPIELEGKHAEAWCYDCHAGVAKPDFECANCHEPPGETHFGDLCEDCHTPAGFEGAVLPPELHPVELTGAHLSASCDACHLEGQPSPEYVCGDCHEAPENHLEGTCDTCHTPEGWAESAATITSSAPRITHELEGRDDCLMCHDPEGQVRPAPADHADYANEQCIVCHATQS
jgi:hypothetical protein